MNNKRKELILLGIGITIICFAASISPYLPFASNFDDFHFVSHEIASEEKKFNAQFEVGNEQDIILLTNERSWFTFDGIKQLDTITKTLESHYENRSVHSLSNIELPFRDGLTINQSLLFETISEKEVVKVKEHYADIHTKFVSRDEKQALIFLNTDTNDVLSHKRLSSLLTYFIDEENLDVYSKPLLMQEIQRDTATNLSKTSISTFLLILVSFILLVRSIKPLLIIGFMLMLNMAMLIIYIWLIDIPISPHLSALPALISILTFSDILHITFAKDQIKKKNANALIIPIVLTSATNMIGFVFFMLFSTNAYMIDLSGLSILSLLSSLTGSIVFLKVSNYEDWKFQLPLIEKSSRLVDQLFLSKSHKKILIVLIIGAVSAGALNVYNNIKIDTLSHLDTTLPYSQTAGKLQGDFFGSRQMHIGLQIEEGDSFTQQSLIDNVNLIEKSVERALNPFYISSTNQVLRRFNRFLKRNRLGSFTLPEQIEGNKEKLFSGLKRKAGWYEVVSEDERISRIQLGFSKKGLKNRINAYDFISNQLKHINIKAKLGGIHYFEDIEESNFLDLVLIGAILTALVACLIIMLVVRSLNHGLLFLLANGFPIILALNLMILFDVPLNSSTVFLLTILLGLSLDDSIYLSLKNRLGMLNNHIHYPILITTMVLAFGTLGFWFSSMSWIRPFSGILFVCFLVSLLLDFYLLRNKPSS
jgi:predicted RND superfamily exporter protein